MPNEHLSVCELEGGFTDHSCFPASPMSPVLYHETRAAYFNSVALLLVDASQTVY